VFVKLTKDRKGPKLVLTVKKTEREEFNKFMKYGITLSFENKDAVIRQAQRPRLHSFSKALKGKNMVKGALAFLVEESGRLSIREMKRGLKEVFNIEVSDKNLIDYAEDMRDRNILSKRKEMYVSRKSPYSIPEVGIIKNLISNAPSIRRQYEKWKEHSI
jgi:hypothetical protein